IVKLESSIRFTCPEATVPQQTKTQRKVHNFNIHHPRQLLSKLGLSLLLPDFVVETSQPKPLSLSHSLTQVGLTWHCLFFVSGELPPIMSILHSQCFIPYFQAAVSSLAEQAQILD
ncbi:MAG TPA: hypothetical protein PLS70_11430, partial [Acidobacteriota bacterium]|nr:hypothetical protein [Acidobacteriota bacterium]